MLGGKLNSLTFQEQDILELLIFGNSTSSIAKELLLDKHYVNGIIYDLSETGLVSRTMNGGYTFQYQSPVSEFFISRQQTLLENVDNRMMRA